MSYQPSLNPLSGARATDDTLNAILRRLERIEKSAGSPSTTSPQSGTPASLETTHLQSGTQSSRLSPFVISRDRPAVAASDASHRHSTTKNVLATSPSLPERGPHAVLQEALRRVQDLNIQALSIETVTTTIDVPPELAKTWIQRYFEVMPTDIFLSLVDRRVIELLPDMIGLPHIHLDPAILVVYYYILRMGCTIPVVDQEQNVHFTGIHYARSMYIYCLRAIPNWQREAVGSTTDLVAATVLTQAASDALDPQLSAQLFQLASKYAIGLDLHNTDSPNYPSGFGQDNIDEVRRGFWELMHYEFFHRLVYDYSPTMTAQMKQWIVSLPWLESCERPVSQEVPTIRFILKSRLTFILAEFFMLLENISGRFEGELFAQVLALCQQIDDISKDWDITGAKTGNELLK
ncbi:fungal specific transcription factor factor [Fusarium sp. NRRL 25303]|nr:fungal specific transcription factor factor [Fusarium sp. NRRL 25303]